MPQGEEILQGGIPGSSDTELSVHMVARFAGERQWPRMGPVKTCRDFPTAGRDSQSDQIWAS
jgi:hypothetical protein